jgi:hypothetical protein
MAENEDLNIDENPIKEKPLEISEEVKKPRGRPPKNPADIKVTPSKSGARGTINKIPTKEERIAAVYAGFNQIRPIIFVFEAKGIGLDLTNPRDIQLSEGLKISDDIFMELATGLVGIEETTVGQTIFKIAANGTPYIMLGLAMMGLTQHFSTLLATRKLIVEEKIAAAKEVKIQTQTVKND